MTTRELALQHNRPLRIEASGGVVVVECVAGTVWLTSADRPGDVFLRAGESLAVHGQGLTLIEALGDARVVMQPPLSYWMRAITVAKRLFLLSSPNGLLRALQYIRWRNPLAG